MLLAQMTLESTTPDVGRRLKAQEMDLTEVHSPGCSFGRMSVRQRRRAVDAATPQIPSEMNKAVEAVRFVSAHLKNEDDFGEVSVVVVVIIIVIVEWRLVRC